MYVYDNVRNNQLFTNFTSVENKETSSLMYNSLCNWETILHVGKAPKATPKFSDLATYSSQNILSIINYDNIYNTTKYPSYNFIADLSDDKFLMPIANLNAPYFYTQENNLCSIGEYDPSFSSALLGVPIFPTEAVLSIFVGLLIGGLSGSLVGAGLGSLAGFSLGYEAIVDFLKDLAEWSNLDARLREIWQPNYDGYPFGSPDKILLNISKDGGFWYNLEANIFRYDNTPALVEQEFDFVTVIKNSGESSFMALPELTEFKFIYTSDKSDLIDNIFIKYTINIDCDMYESLQSSADPSWPKEIDGKILSHGDIFNVNIVNNNSDYECKSQNNIRIFIDGESPIWSDKLFATNELYATYNDVITFDNNIFDSNDNYIITNNEIPYNIFKVGDIIDVYNEQNRNDSSDGTASGSVKILSKAKIFKENKYHSVFSVNSQHETPTQALVSNNNILSNNRSQDSIDGKYCIYLVFNYDDQKNKPINNWSFEKQSLDDTQVSEKYFSVNSVGSYGDLSLKKDKNILSYILKENKLQQLDEMYNNTLNNKIKYNSIELSYLSPTDTVLVDRIKGNSVGFAYDIGSVLDNKQLFYNYDKNINIFDTNKTKLENDLRNELEKAFPDDNVVKKIEDNLEKIDKEILTLKNKFETFQYQYLINGFNTNILYLRVDDEGSLPKPQAGKIKIEDCFVKKETYRIEGHQETLSAAIDRLNKLNESLDEDATFYGNINDWFEIFFSSYKPSLSTAINYYNSIINNNNTAVNIEIINKVRSYVETLYEEKNSILKLLNDTVANIYDKNSQILTLNSLYSIEQLNNLYSGSIEPTYTINITIFPDNDLVNISKIKIEYIKTSSNKYWINIDPKQSCSISEELRPRVLKKTKYTCTYLDIKLLSSNFISNNICPRFAYADPEFRIEDGGKEDFEFSGDSAIPELNLNGNTYTYKIKDIDIINKKLSYINKYSSIVGWTEQTIKRTMYTSSNDIFLTTDTLDILIQVEETYDVAISKEENISIADGLAQGIFKNDGSSDINVVGGINYNFGCDIIPSANGLGLMSLNGQDTRVGSPTRVYNIFNLDDASQILVKFRKIPRILRGVDVLAKVFRFGAFGEYLQKQTGNPLSPIETVLGQGTLNNNFYMWECLKADFNNKLTKTDNPTIFKLFNEMIFRSFYGSVDNIELRKNIMKSYYAHDLVPFEFFNKPPPE